MEKLDEKIIIDGLENSIFACNFKLHETATSTNVILKDMAKNGAPEGTIVIAEEQTAGKGRLGRQWLSKKYENLMFSVLLRPRGVLKPESAFVLTMIMALGVRKGILKITGLDPSIKWPNDIYFHEKKLAGILTEFSVKEKRLEYVVVGIGLNVNQEPLESDAVKGLLKPATSIKKEAGKTISRNLLIVEILKGLERYYLSVLSGNMDDVYKEWNDCSMLMGREVEIAMPKGNARGRAVRIDRTGALILENENGEEIRILAGDASVIMK